MLVLGMASASLAQDVTAQQYNPATDYSSNYTPGLAPQFPFNPQFNHAFGSKQGLNIDDPFTVAALTGGLNAAYTTIVGLTVNSRTTDVCNKVNDILGVSDLATSTLAQGAASTEAGLTTTQAAIDGLVAKINEILQKSTLSC